MNRTTMNRKRRAFLGAVMAAALAGLPRAARELRAGLVLAR
jgi:hypothetical protein